MEPHAGLQGKGDYKTRCSSFVRCLFCILIVGVDVKVGTHSMLGSVCFGDANMLRESLNIDLDIGVL